MSGLVVGALLVAAVLHAGWNAIAKQIPDRLVSSGLIGVAYLVFGFIGVWFVQAPLWQAVPYVIASAIMQTVYLILLTASYKHGEFSRVYPLARGLSVLVVTLFSTLVLGEVLDLGQQIGVALMTGAVLSLTLLRSTGAVGTRSRAGVPFAILTGLTIATYSLIDGVGVRQSGSPLGYAMWLFLLQGLLLPLTCLVLESNRREYYQLMKRHWKVGGAAGLMSLVAYAIVIWAQSVTPLALVSALRETSVLLAGIIGFLFFKERFSVVRLMITIIAVGGIAVLQLG